MSILTAYALTGRSKGPEMQWTQVLLHKRGGTAKSRVRTSATAAFAIHSHPTLERSQAPLRIADVCSSSGVSLPATYSVQWIATTSWACKTVINKQTSRGPMNVGPEQFPSRCILQKLDNTPQWLRSTG